MLLQLGRTGATDQRNLGDSEGQRGTANLEVTGRLAAIHLGRETAGLRFHTAEATGSKPVTPTSENRFQILLPDPGCQHIASKPP